MRKSLILVLVAIGGSASYAAGVTQVANDVTPVFHPAIVRVLG
jgi:hypothetical protein